MSQTERSARMTILLRDYREAQDKFDSARRLLQRREAERLQVIEDLKRAWVTREEYEDCVALLGEEAVGPYTERPNLFSEGRP